MRVIVGHRHHIFHCGELIVKVSKSCFKIISAIFLDDREKQTYPPAFYLFNDATSRKHFELRLLYYS